MSEVRKPDQKQDRGQLRIDEEECKGCGLCIEACPPKVIAMSERLNHYGYRTALYAGAGCTGCGICFMACPEPGAITVYRLSRAGLAAFAELAELESAGEDARTTAGEDTGGTKTQETGATRGTGAPEMSEVASECASN